MVAGPAVPSRPSPCHFWNAITANRVCSPAFPSTASGRQEDEVGEPLLQVAHGGRRVGGRLRRRLAGRRQVGSAREFRS